MRSEERRVRNDLRNVDAGEKRAPEHRRDHRLRHAISLISQRAIVGHGQPLAHA